MPIDFKEMCVLSLLAFKEIGACGFQAKLALFFLDFKEDVHFFFFSPVDFNEDLMCI